MRNEKRDRPRTPLSVARAPESAGAARSRSREPLLRCASVLAAVVVHAGIFGVMRVMPAEARTTRAEPATPELFEIDLPKPEEPAQKVEEPLAPPVVEEPPPPPDAVKPPPALRMKAAPAPVAPPPVEAPAEPPPPSAPASEAAQAAEVVTAEGPADSAKDAIVSGQAGAFAGGSTASAGTSATAIRDPNARADGVKGGTGTSAPDRSRAASLLGGTTWDCRTPSEAEDEGQERATVQLRLKVSKDGRVETAEVLSDPGYGFGHEALRCARQKRFSPALNAAGVAIESTQIVNVAFRP